MGFQFRFAHSFGQRPLQTRGLGTQQVIANGTGSDATTTGDFAYREVVLMS